MIPIQLREVRRAQVRPERSPPGARQGIKGKSHGPLVPRHACQAVQHRRQTRSLSAVRRATSHAASTGELCRRRNYRRAVFTFLPQSFTVQSEASARPQPRRAGHHDVGARSHHPTAARAPGAWPRREAGPRAAHGARGRGGCTHFHGHSMRALAAGDANVPYA